MKNTNKNSRKNQTMTRAHKLTVKLVAAAMAVAALGTSAAHAGIYWNHNETLVRN